MPHAENCIKCLLFVVGFVLVGCSATPDLEADAQPPQLPVPEYRHHTDDRDPLEGYNRRMYWFNSRADKYVILPVVEGYQWVMPDIAEQGVTNFFDNVYEIRTFLNSLLQFKFSHAGKTAARFGINTTVGLLGFLDPATDMGLTREDEDFGQTLGRWGVGQGPYLVLPIVGPSSVRDTAGLAVDNLIYAELIDELKMKWQEEWALDILRGIDVRSNIPFRYYEMGSAFEYELVRDLYFRSREIQVKR